MKKTEETEEKILGRWKELRGQVADLLKASEVESAQVGDLLSAFEVESARVEKIATDAQQYAENIVETVHEPLIVLDKDLRVVTASRSFCRTFKVSRQETEGCLIYDLGNQQWDIPALRKLLEEILPQNTTVEKFEVEHTFETIGNKIMLLNARKIYRAMINTELILLAIEDITDTRWMEELSNQKERLAVTLRSIGDGVVTTDLNGNVGFLNKVAEKLTGWRNEEAIGKPLTEVFCIINELTGEPCPNPVEKVIETGGIVGLANHTVLIAKDGTERIVADSAAPIKDKDSKTIGVILVFRDITHQRKMEEEAQKLQHIESIGLLAGGIAHDFNNILASILLNTQIAEMKKGEDITRYLDGIKKATIRATDLTHQLLTFAKGGLPIKKVSAMEEFKGMIEDTIDFSLAGSNIRCEFLPGENLWPVEIDAAQISQVLNNLILNAKEAQPGGGTIEIKIKNVTVAEGELPIKGGKYIKISVSDHGIGICQEDLGRIFDPYFSIKQEGRGLGLASCYSIIKNHNGYIDVESKLGAGTTFHLYLPAAGGKPVEKEKMIRAIRGEGRILLMDDEKAILESTGEVLKYLGYEVECARDGDQAIKRYKEAKESKMAFDAVILDLTIPGGMGGKETIKKLCEIDPEIRAIAFSGYSTDPVMAHPKEYGFSAVMVKPYLVEDMSAVLHKLIGKRPGKGI